jgi:hypothetical protein
MSAIKEKRHNSSANGNGGEEGEEGHALNNNEY